MHAHALKSDKSRACTTQLLESLHRGYHAAVLYAGDHPAVGESVAACTASLKGALGSKNTVAVSVAQDRIIYTDDPTRTPAKQKPSPATPDNHPPPEPDALGEVAAWLHQLDVASIEFHRGLNAKTFERLIGAFLIAIKDNLRGEPLVTWIQKATRGLVKIQPISYAGLRLSEGASQPASDTTDPHTPKVTWSDLVQGATDGADQNLSSEQLAERVNNALGASHSRAGDGTASTGDQDPHAPPSPALEQIRSNLRGVVKSSSSMQSGERDQTLQSLRDFVAAVNPEVRGALIRVDAGDPDASLALLTELSDVLPLGDVLDALGGVEQSQGRISTEAVRLFKKLAQVSANDAEQRSQLEQAAHRWQGRSNEDLSSIGGSLSELLKARGEDEYSPEDYQASLDGIVSSIHRAEGTTNYAAVMDSANNKTHAARIAATIADTSPDGQDPSPRLFTYIADTINDLIDDRQYTTLLSGVRAAMTYLAGQGEPETRDAAKTLTESLDPDRVDCIIDNARHDNHLPEPAVALLRHCTLPAFSRVMDALASNTNPSIRDALQTVVRTSSDDRVNDVFKQFADGDDSKIDAVVAAIQTVDTERALALLDQLINNQHPKIRHRGYAVLAATKTPWPPRTLRTALAEKDPDTQSLAIDHLEHCDDDESLQLLGAYLEGTLSGNLPSGTLSVRVVELLAKQQTPGVLRLCDALRFLGRRPNPRNVVLATRLADTLSNYRDHTEVSRALLRWKLSPAHLLSVVLLGSRTAEVST